MGYNVDYRGIVRLETTDKALIEEILGEDKRDLLRRHPTWAPAIAKMKYCYHFDLNETDDDMLQWYKTEKSYNLEEALQALIDISNIENTTTRLYGNFLASPEGDDPYKIVCDGATVRTVDIDWDAGPTKTDKDSLPCPHCGGLVKLTL